MAADPASEPAHPEVLARLEADFTADLSRLRDSAERWRNGIAMVTGLVSAALVFKAPDLVGLAPLGKLVLFAVVALAIAAGIVACLCAVWAAAGLPVLTQRQITVEGATTEQRRKRTRAVRLLYWAVGLSLVMVVLLMVSVGLTWFLPRTDTSPPTARLELSDGRIICGRMVRLDDREVAITVFGQSVVVPRAEISTLSETQSCG